MGPGSGLDVGDGVKEEQYNTDNHFDDGSRRANSDESVAMLDATGDTEISDNGELNVKSEANQPQTPKSVAKVIIYTPARNWVPAEDEDDDVFYTANAHRQNDNEDDVSVFSMDLGHNIDELEMRSTTPRTRSRGQDDEPLNEGILPPERGRSRKRSSSPRRGSMSFTRDSKGRFSRSVNRAEKTPSLPPKKRSSSSQASRPTSAQAFVRDSHGRFSSSKNKATKETPASLSTKKRRSSSKSEKNPLSAESKAFVRDSKGRFSRSSDRSRAGIVETPILPPKKTLSVSASGDNSLKGKTQESVRDEHGKFSRKSKVNVVTPILPPGKQRSLSKSGDDSSNSRTQQLVRDEPGRFAKKSKTEESDPEFQPRKKDSRSDELAKALGEAAAEAQEERDAKPAVKPKKTKKSVQPTNSPYFIPPVTPSKQSKKDNGESASKKTPKRSASKLSKSGLMDDDDEDVPSSQTSSKARSPGGLVSCIPFPPLNAPNFGLIQEKLAHDPFRLLIAVTFLIRTHGKHAIPVFYTLMSRYPTPESLLAADKEDILPIIRHLGLQNQRASTYQMYAKIWLENKPVKGKRYAVKGYPGKDSGRDIKKGEVLNDEDEREAWEIGHMTQGPYALDSWRIFCRDELRGLAEDWTGKGAKQPFQPEWMRVLPEDKELRAYLRWMWLKEGFEWDPFTGEKEVAGQELVRAAMEGRIAWDGMGGMRILDQPIELLANLSQVGNLGDEDSVVENGDDVDDE